MKLSRKNGILLFYKLYRAVTKGVKVSRGVAELGFVLSSIQYASFLIDQTNFPQIGFLNHEYIRALNIVVGLTRFQRLAVSSTEPEICFFVFFSFSLLYLALAVAGIIRHPLKHFEFLPPREDNLEWIIKKEEDSEQNVRINPNGFRMKLLQAQHLLLPFIFLPATEILLSPFSELYKEKLPSNYILKILGLTGVSSMFFFLAVHCFFFNTEGFDLENRLNRSVYQTDLKFYIPMLLPIIISVSNRFSATFYILLPVQSVLFFSIFLDYRSHHHFFCPNTNQSFMKWTLFKMLFCLVLLVSSVLSTGKESLVFFLLTVPIILRISGNIAGQMQIRLFSNLYYVEEFKDGKLVTDKNFKISTDRVLLIFYNFYAYFYYLDEEYYLRNSVFPKKEPDVAALPLEVVGEMRSHFEQCLSKDCPLSKRNKESQWKDGEKFSFLWSDLKVLKVAILKFIRAQLKIACEIDSKSAKLELALITFLLMEPRELHRAIPPIHHVRSSIVTLHETLDSMMITESVKAIISENDLQYRSSKLRNLQNSTQFNTQVLVKLEKDFVKLKSNIFLYWQGYKEFLLLLSSESPDLRITEKQGDGLLILDRQIKFFYMQAERNVMFMKNFLNYLKNFHEDELKLIKEVSENLKEYTKIMLDKELDSEKRKLNKFAGDSTSFFTENSGFIHISGMSEKLGRIERCDENIAKTFKYSSSKAIEGVKINDLMPKIFAKNHDQYLREFFLKSRSDFIYREHELFALDQNNRIFPFYVTVKPYFNTKTLLFSFIGHVKPKVSTSLGKRSFVICDELGNIDSFSGPVSEMMAEAFGKVVKSSVPIYLLIPAMKDYFYKVALTYLCKMTQEEYFDRKFAKVPELKKMFSKDPFVNQIRTPVGDMVFQMLIYDKYPNLPDFLTEKDANIKNSENPDYYRQLEKYFASISKIMRESKAEASTYRVEATVEKFAYNNLTIHLISISKIRFLYKRQISTVKDIGQALRQTMVMMPKLIKKANNIKTRVRLNSYIHTNTQDRQSLKDDDDEKVNPTPPTANRRGSLQFGKNNLLFGAQKPAIAQALSPPQETPQGYSLAVPSQVFPGGNSLRRYETNDYEESDEDECYKEERNKTFIKQTTNNPLPPEMIRDNQKYYTDEFRYMYKYDSGESHKSNALGDAKSTRSAHTNGGSSIDSRSSYSSMESRSNLRFQIKQMWSPLAYKLVLIFLILLNFSVFLVFLSIAWLGSMIYASITTGVSQGEKVDNFKIILLDVLLTTQRYKYFQGEDTQAYVHDLALKFKDSRLVITSPPLPKLDSSVVDIWTSAQVFKKGALLTAIFAYENAAFDLQNNKDNSNIILENGMAIHDQFAEITKTAKNLNEYVHDMKQQTLYLSFVALGFSISFTMAIAVLIHRCYQYLNYVIKLLLSLTMNEYKELYDQVCNFKLVIADGNNLRKKFSRAFSGTSSKGYDALKKEEDRKPQGKKSRHSIMYISFPWIAILIMTALLISVSVGFLMLSLSQTQMLDDSLEGITERNLVISRIRERSMILLIRLSDSKFQFNIYNLPTQDNENYLAELSLDISNLLNMNLNSGDEEKKDFERKINENVCTQAVMQTAAQLAECLSIAGGITSKGLYSLLMYVVVQFRSAIEGRVNLSVKETFDEMYSIMKVIGLKVNSMIVESNQLIQDNFNGKKANTVMMNVLISIGISALIILILVPLRKRIKKRMFNVRKILGLFPFSLISKSTRIKQYFNNTKSESLY